jgi:hypothetical protein
LTAECGWIKYTYGLLPRLGLKQYQAEKESVRLNDFGLGRGSRETCRLKPSIFLSQFSSLLFYSSCSFLHMAGKIAST